jgi:hypothetical protein
MTWGVTVKKKLLYILRCPCTFHVTLRVCPLHCISFLSSMHIPSGHGMAGQLTAQAHPLMAAGLAAAAAPASLPVQATRDPISCVPLAHPFGSEFGRRGLRWTDHRCFLRQPRKEEWVHPRGIMWGTSTCCARCPSPPPLQFLFVHSGRGG